MQRVLAQSPSAQQAMALVNQLQQQLVSRMEAISHSMGNKQLFDPIEWFRDAGVLGGGVRYIAMDNTVFNRGSVNVSQVQYEADASKPLASATAFSSIIHPKNPLAPSIHLHVSWTELKSGHAYWRIMADLNPAIIDPIATKAFKNTLMVAAPKYYEAAFDQGDQYFFIPALNRHRGACHFYLENFHTDDTVADASLAKTIITQVIHCYANILEKAIQDNPAPTSFEYEKQLAYHTLYLFQVLTLDRGTTSGLLVHDQNDVGILGSIPSHIDKSLLADWQHKVPTPQDALVANLIACIEDQPNLCFISDEIKCALANTVRQHYKKHPEALALQASGHTIPPTVSNHR